jgi:hypothetical protein
MPTPLQLEYTPQNRWMAMVARIVELDVEGMRRRLYQRQNKRYDLEWGQARVEYDVASGRPPEHLTVMQVSPGGVMLRGFGEPAPGTGVTLQISLDEESAVLRGIIRHVTQSLGGYKIGIELLF